MMKIEAGLIVGMRAYHQKASHVRVRFLISEGAWVKHAIIHPVRKFADNPLSQRRAISKLRLLSSPLFFLIF